MKSTRHSSSTKTKRLYCQLAFCFTGLCAVSAPALAQTPANAGGPQVAVCSWTPNCASSNGKPGESKYIAPLKVKSGDKEPMTRLKALVGKMAGAKLVVEQPFLLKYEFTTPTMKFIDDVQFVYIPTMNYVEMRSASRLGISDFGVNSKRLEEVRSAFEK
ncbi:MAG: DUF1499 domain-containing protein [Burkholderiales bacterium]|nr:DUF1499 domain-containing protein [Burkholderiales bacterium]